ncbi:MAG: ComEA family DNA-binding protein [Polyangia bacterium]
MRRALAAASLLALALDGSAAFARSDALAPAETRASPEVDAPAEAHAPPVAAGLRSSDGVVNLNDATEEELARLPGIGPGKARAIAEHRHAHPFRRTDDLTKVKGIGRKTFGRLRPYITTVGPTTLSHDVKLHR